MAIDWKTSSTEVRRARDALVVALYQDGVRTQVIEGSLAITPTMIYRALSRAGFDALRQGRMNRCTAIEYEARCARVVEMRRAGQTIEEMATEFGCTAQNVSRILADLKAKGVPDLESRRWTKDKAVPKQDRAKGFDLMAEL